MEEAVASGAISPGDIRYMVLFEDPSLTIPLVRTLQFLRTAKGGDGADLLIFVELSALVEPRKTFVRVADEQDLLDGNGLVEKLKKCVSGSLASDR